jgi:hypothetical protein
MVKSLNRSIPGAGDGRRKSAASVSQDYPMPDHPLEGHLLVRQYKHLINPAGGLDSVCTRCSMVIASGANEWSLLESEQQHVCPR